MLRWNQTTRFALQNSPTREQREVMFVEVQKPIDAKNTPNPIDGRIQTVQYEGHGKIVGVAPELLIEMPDAEVIADEIMMRGSKDLSDAFVETRHSLKTSNPASTDTDVIQHLMQKSEMAIKICSLYEARLQRHEELLQRIESTMKKIINGNISEAKEAMTVLEKWLLEEKIQNAPTKQEVVDALSFMQLNDDDHADVHQVLGCIMDVMKMHLERATFVPSEAILDTQEQIRSQREAYIQLQQKQSNALRLILENEIQEKARKAWNVLREQWNKYVAEKNEDELLAEAGISIESANSAFAENVRVLERILRTNHTDTKKLVAYEDARFTQESSNALLSLRALEARMSTASGMPLWLKQAQERDQRQVSLVSSIGNHATTHAKGNPIAQDIERVCRVPESKEERGSWRHSVLRTPRTELSRLETISGMGEKGKKINTLWQNQIIGPFSAEEGKRLKQRIQSMFPQLLEHMTHSICAMLGMQEQLTRRKHIILGNLQIASDNQGTPKGANAWKAACIDAEAIFFCIRQLSSLYEEENVQRCSATKYAQQKDSEGNPPPQNSQGFYDTKTGKIFINTDACDNDEELIRNVIEHERGHGIIDILSRRSKVFPYLCAGVVDRMQEAAKQKGLDWQDLAESLARKWGYEFRRDDEHSQDNFVEELLVRHGDVLSGRKMTMNPEEKRLLELLGYDSSNADNATEKKDDAFARKFSIADTGSDILRGESESTIDESSDVRNYRKEIHDLDTALRRIDSFFTVYPERASDPGIPETRAKLTEAVGLLKEKMESGEDLARFESEISVVANSVGEIEKQIKEFDSKQWDLTEAKKSEKRGWRAIIGSINWMSISDIGIMFSEASEDIQRMWKRRGEGVRATVGKRIFGSIPENLPYIGRLSSEFAGREQSSEQEEVGVWEKRYETVDSWTLLHDMLPRSRSKDEIKAILNLLTKRGRMDWNFEGLWNVLESVSDYHMPHAACIRDPLLRDMYLQKLCANIWSDKDQFRSWKNANDSGISSGKSGHQATVDSLSATKKGLATRAKYLLEKHITQKNGGTISAEEEVDPHLYEQILHYAMRNGKMTMEQKIFYFIQGIAHGLLSMDRMQAFVGEQGEILNSFPFIDFFNGKTYDDVMKMAETLGYPTLTEPDAKTAHFLMEEIAHDEGTRQRAAKALKAPQNIDHEDMPLLISMYDHRAINDLIAVTSGCTPKISKEGMKNIFVGYNSIFQYFAIRAKMARDHGTPFSDYDAKECAKLMAAYANFDNRVTIKADPNERPSLSFSNINDDIPVSGSKKTREYRDRAVSFVHEVTGKLGITHAGEMPIGTYVRKRLEDSQDVEYKKCNKQSDAFEQQLQSSSVSNKDKLIQILASYADRSPDQGGFIPENDDYSYSKVQSFLGTSVEKRSVHNSPMPSGFALAA